MIKRIYDVVGLTITALLIYVGFSIIYDLLL